MGKAVGMILSPVSKQQADILMHALGLPSVRTEYRNHFVTSEGSDDWVHCESLRELGFMTRRGPHELFGGGNSYCYQCTESGKTVARYHAGPPPEVSRGRKRYLAFLSDDCGLSFIEWLKWRGKEVR